MQVAIFAFGVTCAFLSQSRNQATARYACLFGMAGQPFWLMETAGSGQWGMFGLSCLYTLAWARGIYNFWIRP